MELVLRQGWASFNGSPLDTNHRRSLPTKWRIEDTTPPTILLIDPDTNPDPIEPLSSSGLALLLTMAEIQPGQEPSAANGAAPGVTADWCLAPL